MDIYFPEADFEQFEFPMSGYIYATDVKRVTYRARILDIRHDFPREFRDAIPLWRNHQTYTRDFTDYISFFVDQIDTLHPQRELKDFIEQDGKSVKAPTRAKYTLINDSLYLEDQSPMSALESNAS
ncbi:MAG: hypothetical protein ACTSWA_11910 [Candidatus Thorarchaeota archaeon]